MLSGNTTDFKYLHSLKAWFVSFKLLGNFIEISLLSPEKE